MNFWKRTSISWATILAFLIGPYQLRAQEPSFVTLSGDREFNLNAGEERMVTLTFMINEDYHIQAATLDNEYLIPTRLTFSEKSEISVGAAIFPPPVKFWMKGVDEPLHVFSHELEVKVPIRIVESRKGQHLVSGSLYFQACDSSKCYYPRNLDFQMQINIQ